MLWVTVRYDPEDPLLDALSRALHSRPRYAHGYWEANGGFTLFGRPFVDTGSEYHSGLPFASLDSGYAWLGLVSGLASAVVCCVAYVRGAMRAARGRDWFVGVSLLALASLYLLVECYPLALDASFPALLLAAGGTQDAGRAGLG